MKCWLIFLRGSFLYFKELDNMQRKGLLLCEDLRTMKDCGVPLAFLLEALQGSVLIPVLPLHPISG